MNNSFKRLIKYCIALCMILALCSCGSQSQSYIAKGPDYRSLRKTGEWELKYAKGFKVYEYGEYSLLTIGEGDEYLIVPESSEIPKNTPKNMVIIKKPLNNVYQVSSSIMDYILTLDSLEHIGFTGTKESDWHLAGAKNAMKDGSLVYAGKYSQPDYELLVSKQCELAIENTMIWHNPEVKEKLEALDIPVLVEHSAYETHPLGRLEWIKLFGLLFDKEKEVNDFFDKEEARALEIMDKEKTDKTLAFFYVTANGAINVKKPNDYVAKIVELAGGNYLPNDIGSEDESALSGMNMTVEDFYLIAHNADILIYNATTVDELNSINDLIKKNPNFADFKAVKEGKVYLTGNNFYQESTGTCMMIEDINKVLNDNNEGLTFLKKLE